MDGTSAGGGKDDMKMTIPRYILCLVESDRQALAKFTRSPSFLTVLLEGGAKLQGSRSTWGPMKAPK